MLTIRPVNQADAQAIQTIYAPYVENTAITFEYEVPSVQEFEKRISKTIEKYPYLVKNTLIQQQKRMDKFSAMLMLQPTMLAQPMIGRQNCLST